VRKFAQHQFWKIPFFYQFLVGMFCLGAPFFVFAQNQFITFSEKSWGNNGENRVHVATKDTRGFMWFGTENGLVRWDGLEWKKWQYNPEDSSSLRSYAIWRDMFWNEKEQTLWIPNSGALSIFDPVTERFTHYQSDPEDSTSLPHPITNCIFRDRQGIIWIGTGDGLARFTGDKNHRTFKTIKSDKKNKVVLGEIFEVTQDFHNDSLLWLGMRRSGLIKWNKFTSVGKRYFEETKGIPAMVRRVISLPNGLVYLRSWNTGRVLFDPKQEMVVEDFTVKQYHESTFRNQSIRLLPTEKNEERVWLNRGNDQGLFLMNSKDFTFHFIRKKMGIEGRRLSLNPLLVEADHTLWVGTPEGVFKEQIHPNFVENFFYQFPENWQTVSNPHYKVPRFRGIFHKGLNQLVLPVVDKKGLYVFDLNTRELIYFFYPNATEESVVDLFSLDLLNENQGLAIINHRLFEIRFAEQSLKEIPLPVRSRLVHTDRSGRVWILSDDDALFEFDFESKGLQKIDWGEGLMFPQLPRRLFSDAKGNIWIDFRMDFIWVYEPKNQKLHQFSGMENSNFRPAGFAEDPSGQIYTNNYYYKGSHCGLIDPEHPEEGIQIVDWMKDIGVATARNDIEFDQRGRLWMSSSAGLEVIDFERKSTVVLNESHGVSTWDGFIQSNPSQNSFLTKLADGKMVIIYPGGFGLFHPDSLLKSREEFLTLPKPYLTSISVGGYPLKPDSAAVFKKRLVLLFEQNNISFNYSAIDHSDYYALEFMHRLEGVEDDWIPSDNRYASYSNLQPGEYFFKVKVLRGDEIPAQVLSFSLKILPPWYRTWWACLIWITLVFGSIYWFYRFQLNRKLAESEAQRLKELDQAKNILYTNITHEFRTPLTIILGMADQMKTDPVNWFNEGLRLIRRNGKQLLHLVNQMLDLSKLESGQLTLKPILGDIVSFIHYLSESFHSYADSKDIRLHFSSEFKELQMDYDPEKIQHILANLLSNAIKFTPAGGDVYIQLLSGKSEFNFGNKTITVQRGKENSSGAYLLLVVKDNGQGINPAHLPYIFDRFYQGDSSSTRKGEGTGIGLALTKELVKLMDGEIMVESESLKSSDNRGSKFTIALPITQNAEPMNLSQIKTSNVTPTIESNLQSVSDEQRIDVINANKPIVLIIEDNADVITYLTSFFSKDYQIETATNGQKGIDKALEIIPDLIVSDVMMPEKDGFEVCETLKTDERTSHIPIILLTAKSDPIARLEGLTHGADAYLAKPFNKEELLVRIENLIELRRRLHDYYNRAYDSKITNKPITPTTEDLFLQRLITIVEENLSNEHFGLPDLCRKANLSRSQLFRKLKALTGKSTTNFIRSIRLAKGKELLETTDQTVSEVAYSVGFRSVPYFSTMFKEVYGITPGEVRR
jgi:signal transduction histidine kinase/DNA-binding response OmpR family regulator/ligand-binding sensor domain-containing protein